jgi:hypothetical protein
MNSQFHRRDILKSGTATVAGLAVGLPHLATLGMRAAETAPGVVDIGNRLELFFDDYLIQKLDETVRRRIHEPTPKEVVLTTDRPWEGNTCAYYTLFQDDDIYRIYYRGSHFDTKTGKAAHREVACYAESRDGVHWERPELGIVDWEGSKKNNIILDGIGTHCFVAFRDENPNCPADAKYKGISRGRPTGKKGLYVYKSPDGIHWTHIQREPVITSGAFDSQNLAFWDPAIEKYVCYSRLFRNKVRAIQICTSDDFVSWTEPVDLQYGDAPNQHLYTNAISSYPRAPHLRIGFPTRYDPKLSQVEPIFMASRDGLTFQRFNDPVIPRTAPQDRQGNRSNYMANGLFMLPGNDREYAVYGTEAYYVGPNTRLRRFMYRLDGFVSLRADKQGQIRTRPFTLQGPHCLLNYKTENGGSVQVEVQDADGNPLPGLGLADCQPLAGDEIAAKVRWSGDLSKFSGKTIRLRFAVDRTDLYSLQFPAA